MGKPKIEELVRGMSEPIAASLGLELVDVEYIKEGGSWFLRIFIDKPDGITHTDCHDVSQQISKLMDEKDYISQAYILEVSSPGIERPLNQPRDFLRFRGHKIRAATFSPVNGQKEFVGELEGLENGELVINIKGKQMILPMEQVAKVRLEAEF